MATKVKRTFPGILLFFLGLITIFLIGPNLVTAEDPMAPCADATGVSDISTSYINHDGWTGYRCENSRTGVVHIHQKRTDPQTGETQESDTHYNKKTGESETSMTTTHKDKSKDKETDLRPAAGYGPPSNTKVHWDAQGHKTSVVITNPDGSIETTIYNPETGKRSTITVKNANGTTGIINFGPDGKPTSQVECDSVGNCISKAPDLAGGMDKFQAADKFRGDPGVNKAITAVEKPKADVSGARDKVKADVLQQIEGKPRGDLGARERVKTGVMDQSKVGALQVTPKGRDKLPYKPKGEDLAGAKPKVPTGLEDRFKNEPGEAVGSIPQALPPDSPAGKLGGRVQFDKKLRTEGVQPFKEKVKVQDSAVGQKEKLSVTPRSQSVGQTQLQGTGAAKSKVQTQAVQPFKGKSKPQDFRLPAGSSAPVLR